MKVLRRESAFVSSSRPVITLGNFDGIHLGHQKILKNVVTRARTLGAPALVYTFDPHPLKVVAPEKCPPLILSMEDKKALMEAAGVDYLVLASFTRALAAMAPEDFAKKVIAGALKAREVLVGENFSFGRGRSGSVERLKELGQDLGFSVEAVPPCRSGGSVGSSSRIWALITPGEVRKASTLLGRAYFLRGRVVRGEAMGRKLGFPTANIEPSSELVPGNGVYAAIARIKGSPHRAMVNIGTRPTFNGCHRTIEVHVLNFGENIYGREISVEFIRRLRDEKAFSDREALIRQMEKDRLGAEKVLSREDFKP